MIKHVLETRRGRKISGFLFASLAAASLGCATYQGTAREARPSTLVQDSNWVMVRGFPRVMQKGNHDCGAAALSAVLEFWGKPTTADQISNAVGKRGEQLRARDIETYAKSAGLSSFVFFGTMNDIVYEVKRGRPIIVGVGKPYADKKALAHYEVVVGYEPKKRQVLLLDPARGWQVDSFEGFAKEWSVSKGVTVVAFLSESAVQTASK
jgi:ABC-type bacteriocin/lantibiotic exporter with double-glycine peptidase domain